MPNGPHAVSAEGHNERRKNPTSNPTSATAHLRDQDPVPVGQMARARPGIVKPQSLACLAVGAPPRDRDDSKAEIPVAGGALFLSKLKDYWCLFPWASLPCQSKCLQILFRLGRGHSFGLANAWLKGASFRERAAQRARLADARGSPCGGLPRLQRGWGLSARAARRGLPRTWQCGVFRWIDMIGMQS